MGLSALPEYPRALFVLLKFVLSLAMPEIFDLLEGEPGSPFVFSPAFKGETVKS